MAATSKTATEKQKAHPKKVADYLSKISDRTGGSDCVYKGLACQCWKLNHGAKLRIARPSNSDPDTVDTEDIITYHEDLLKSARRNGFGLREGRNLHDLELLAQLQHFGAATLLLDFTEQPLVALYFACQTCYGKSPCATCGRSASAPNNNCAEANGKILVVPYRPIPVMEDEEITAREIIEDKSPYIWYPTLYGEAERRIHRQSGLFIINANNLQENIDPVVVPANHKEGILKELETVYRISSSTLFTDISGFSQYNSHDSELNSYRIDLFQARQHYRNKDYAEAKVLYKKIIERNPDSAEEHNFLGIIEAREDNFKKALNYFRQSLEINSEAPKVFLNCASMSIKLGDIKSAKRYLKTASMLAKKINDNSAIQIYAGLVKEIKEIERKK